MIAKSFDLYKKSLGLIPGGSQMFNKRPLTYGSAPYPIFAERAEGPYLYDVDGNRYVDYLLAYGAIHLGYNYPAVKKFVRDETDKRTIHSVNDPLEIELAEELTNTIPSAEMVKYFLSGSEATTAAVRIARAHTGRNMIVKWGYHGWHDWTRIVRGGPTRGMVDYLRMINCPVESITHVPEEVSNSTIELEYNNLGSLESLMRKEGEDIACVIMEPFYFNLPNEGYLQGVKEIANSHGALFILDEVKTGMRVSNGGAQQLFKVAPDLSVFSKAISNGYPFSVVVGKRNVMKTCENLWFAGTNCGNIVGISGALATIREAKKVDAPVHIWSLGTRIMDGIKSLLDTHKIPGKIGGMPPMPYLAFTHDDFEKRKKAAETYLGELVRRGVFMPVEHCFYISYAHSKADIDDTLNAIDGAFKKLKDNL
jgi:glutamate-1-semialdehyde aminotransferase